MRNSTCSNFTPHQSCWNGTASTTRMTFLPEPPSFITLNLTANCNAPLVPVLRQLPPPSQAIFTCYTNKSILLHQTGSCIPLSSFRTSLASGTRPGTLLLRLMDRTPDLLSFTAIFTKCVDKSVKSNVWPLSWVL